MRISTSWMQQSSLNTILDRQSQLNQTQLQLSSGKKILTPSDDPTAAARVVDLNQSINQTEQYQNNINAARQRLSLQDDLLQNAIDLIQQVKVLGLQGVSDTSSPADKIAIATEMESLKNQLAAIANTKNANGEYLFSGFKSDTQPFTQIPAPGGGYAYGGDANQRQIQIGADRLTTDGNSGESIFGAPTGASPPAGPSPGIDNIFEAIDKLVVDLRNNAPQSSSLNDLTVSLNRVTNIESSVGVRLNALDQQESLNADHILNLKKVLSETQDIDFAEAVSKYNLQSVALQAAQQAFVQVQKLSLFNLL